MQLSAIDGAQSFDFGKTSEAYAKYRSIYPDILYTKLKELGVAASGTSWLDLGTGTGILPKNLYNPEAAITGADISKNQIAFAIADTAEHNMKISYIVSPAESTGLPESCFDTITAAQCFAYFDREKIVSEIKRMLKPGGRFIMIFLDWDYDDIIFKQTAKTIKKYNPSWEPANGWRELMYEDIFPNRTTSVYDCAIPFTRESWHGRMCACRGTLASMKSEVFSEWDAEHKDFLNTLPEEFNVKHKLFITVFQF